MKMISSIPTEKFESEFLKSEWYKPFYSSVRDQLNKIVLEPNLEDSNENAVRKYLLWQWREPLLKWLPNNITWHLVRVDLNEFSDLFVIKEPQWEKTFGSQKTLKKVAQAIINGYPDKGAGIKIIQDIKKRIGSYPFIEKLILISTSIDTPSTVIEGNHRAIAFQLKALENGNTSHIPKKLILGTSPHMLNCPWLNTK